MCKGVDYSELRIHQNKCRRSRQLRRNILRTVLSICLFFALTLSANAFLSNAKSDKEIIMYKYYSSRTVEPGDTLWSIAEENKGTEYVRAEDYIEEVMQMNVLQDETISAGQNIIIPYYSSEFIR